MLEPLAADAYASYSDGNPWAPVGEGKFTIELKVDNTVVLTHEQRQTRRQWIAAAEETLKPTFEAMLAASGFPTMPSVRMAAAGADSFELSARDREGRQLGVSGFHSPEYKEVARLFLQIIGQMTGSELLGFMPRMTAAFIREPRPA